MTQAEVQPSIEGNAVNSCLLPTFRRRNAGNDPPATRHGVAEELGIPVFTILAPQRNSLRPGIQAARPWWDLDPNLPEEIRHEMSFMEQAADELMQRHRDGDSTWPPLLRHRRTGCGS